MAYTNHTWVDDELITKEKLNNIENGIKALEGTIPQKVNVVAEASSPNVATTAITGTAADEQLNATVTLVNELKGKVNELIQKLKQANVMNS